MSFNLQTVLPAVTYLAEELTLDKQYIKYRMVSDYLCRYVKRRQ